MLMLCVRRSTCACSALYTREGERETCHALFDWLDWLLYAWLHPLVSLPLVAPSFERGKFRKVAQELSERTDRISTCE